MKPRILTLLAVIIPVGLVLLGCGTDRKEVRLAYRYKAGQSHIYASEIKISSEMAEPGKTPVSKSLSYRSTVHEEVRSMVDSTTARVRLTDAIKKPAPKSEPGNPADPVDSLTQEWSIEYITGADGKMIDIFPQDSAGKDMIAFYKNYYEQALPVFPDTPVAEGYSWTQAVRLIVKGEGDTRAETTYRVKSFVRELGHDCVVIEYDGHLILPFQGLDRDGGSISRIERIKSHGVIYFAYREGTLVRQTETYYSRSEGTRTINDSTRAFTSTGERVSSLVLTKSDN